MRVDGKVYRCGEGQHVFHNEDEDRGEEDDDTGNDDGKRQRLGRGRFCEMGVF